MDIKFNSLYTNLKLDHSCSRKQTNGGTPVIVGLSTMIKILKPKTHGIAYGCTLLFAPDLAQ